MMGIGRKLGGHRQLTCSRQAPLDQQVFEISKTGLDKQATQNQRNQRGRQHGQQEDSVTYSPAFYHYCRLAVGFTVLPEPRLQVLNATLAKPRSEERRVGKECRTRGSPRQWREKGGGRARRGE